MDTVFISILDPCPNKCRGCFAYKTKKLMGYEDFKKIVRQLPKDIKGLTLTGGEPFLHPYLTNMCRFASRFLTKPTILTSGSVKADLKKLKPFIYNIVVTVKYPNEQDSDWKGNGGAFKNATSFLKSACELGIRLGINWAVDRENFVYFEEMVDLAHKYKAKLYVLRYIPYEKSGILSLSDEEWEEFCGKVFHIDGVKIKFPSSYSYQDCSGGMARMLINTDGSVTPCLYWTFESYGNILRNGYQACESILKEWRRGWGFIKGCPCLTEVAS